jgi:hypothetical protein
MVDDTVLPARGARSVLAGMVGEAQHDPSAESS